MDENEMTKDGATESGGAGLAGPAGSASWPWLCWIPGQVSMNTPCKIVEDLGEGVVTIETPNGKQWVEYAGRLTPNTEATNAGPEPKGNR